QEHVRPTHADRERGLVLQAPSAMAVAYPLVAAIPKSDSRAQAVPRLRAAGRSRYRTSEDSAASVCPRIEFGWNHERARPFADGLFLLPKKMNKGDDPMCNCKS